MLKRLIVAIVLPSWLLIGLGMVGGLGTVLCVVVLAFGSWTSSVSSDLQYQCDSAVGPDSGSTETSDPGAFGAPPAPGVVSTSVPDTPDSLAPSEIPTTNPFADLTLDPQDTGVSDWQRACLNAMRTAPYQQPPLQSPASGAVGACARDIALAQVNQPAAPGMAADPASLVKTVVYQASSGALTGLCVPGAPGAAPGALVLPNTVAAQSLCGQRVDPAAISPGDLVFWDYRGYAPVRAGVAVDATELVATDPDTGVTAVWRLPTGSDVRIKRVLGSPG